MTPPRDPINTGPVELEPLGRRAMREEDVERLTAQEIRVARRAAEIAVQEMTAHFYQQVGKTVVQRILIIIGAIFLGYGLAKGWFPVPGGKDG